MWNNLTNYLNLITERKYRTASTVESTDLITLGVKDPTYDGGYQPVLMTFQELSNALGGGSVQSVTGLNTDNTDPLNPVVQIAVDGLTIGGDGTSANPLQSLSTPTAQVVLFADLATTEPLKPCTYNNGIAGVGATLTGNANGQLSTISFTDKIDNVTTALNQIILVKNQSNQTQNGLYLVTQLGDAGNPFILTRTVDADTQAELYPIQVNVFSGSVNANVAFLQKTVDPVVGTNNIVFTTTYVGLNFNPVQMVDTVTLAPLPACTYTNGTNLSLPGSGAALTANANGPIGTINGTPLTNGMRILVRDQVNAAHNGDYTVAAQGSAGSPWKLVRSTVWGNNFVRLQREWKVNNPTSGSYGARYSVNIASLANVNVGVTPLIFIEILSSGLPPWIETNATDLTVWCNGKGNITTNTTYGESALANNVSGINNTSIGLQSLFSNTTGIRNIGLGPNTLFANTIGNDNIAIGSQALENAAASVNNVGIGTFALRATNTGGNNVAIGVSTLQLNTTGSNNVGVGSIVLPNNTTGSSNVAIGAQAMANNTIASGNVAIGGNALLQNISGNQNVAIGLSTLQNNTVGYSNTAIGYLALQQNTTNWNTAVGAESLRNTTSGNSNTAVGEAAMVNNINGSYNTAIGSGAMRLNVSGTQNVAIGPDALRNNTANNFCVAIGNNALQNNTVDSSIGIGGYALYTNTTGGNNCAVGMSALYANTTGLNNVGVGASALRFNTTGGFNVGVGVSVLGSNTTGNSNTAMGNGALLNNTTGSNNVAIGANALYFNTTGGTNTAVGEATSSGNFSASVILGYGATATANNQFVVGSAGFNAGTVTTETITPDTTWLVRINGANYKIPMLLIP